MFVACCVRLRRYTGGFGFGFAPVECAAELLARFSLCFVHEEERHGEREDRAYHYGRDRPTDRPAVEREKIVHEHRDADQDDGADQTHPKNLHRSSL